MNTPPSGPARRAKAGCLLLLSVSVATVVIVTGWEAFHNRAGVAAIREHPVVATGIVIEPEIDGFGGDPAVAYHYTVGGRTYEGYDIASPATGDALRLTAGDRIPIQYAATMPEVSCVAQSTDCPNSVFDPYFGVFVFWSIAFGLSGHDRG